MPFTRREFFTYVGIGSYELMRSQPVSAAVFPTRKRGKGPGLFSPISPSGLDKLILPKGYRYDILASWDDPLGSTGPLGEERFGYDNDYTAFFPLGPGEGLLFVNHEHVRPVFVSGYLGEGDKTREQIAKEKLAVGASILHLKKEKGVWKRIPSKYTKRFTAAYPRIALSGPVSTKLSEAVGTLANCAGGITPWNTVLSCEENFHEFNLMDKDKGLCWATHTDTKIDEAGYGWVVEIDPFGDLPPMKHTALGRFAHENVAPRFGKTGRLVLYMGDDFQDSFLFKYVSDERYDPKASRADKRKLLMSGSLYAADFLAGKWIPLDIKRTPILLKEGFRDQETVLFNAREAAKTAKATPLDRPEDCEIHPTDGSVYIALTNNLKHGNMYGQIVRLVEEKDDAEGEKFAYEIFLAGGPQSGLASPDNLQFDKKGNLWVVCDTTSKELNKGSYSTMMNNGLFMVPTSGTSAGQAFQFASGPNESELTGPSFTPNEDTLFLSVQHPGETSISSESPTSRWPSGKGIPRPAVVAISGFKS